MKILVTGSDGQLGLEIQNISKKYNTFDWVFSTVNSLDFSRLDHIKCFLDTVNPCYIINCAAYTNVDKAEAEPKIADLINHQAVDVISKWTTENNKKLIHISTDYVFNGFSKNPIDENSNTDPLNEYGRSKLKGEQVCLNNDSNSIIIRTSWLYSSYRNNFVKIMIKLMEKRDSLNVVNDQFGSPTYAADLADTILKIINFKNWFSGLYHYSNEGEITWFDFANEIKYLNNFTIQINGVPSEEYPVAAKRPKYSLLDKTKIKNIYNIKVPYYRDSLEKCIKILQSKK
ncbi:dTDP-4-dehydrorhamnose reductase [Flavobacteriaceae bacterium]|jgi:dTDP-4-dehydrorhamnose reductase|nr:dTDP-4-dehydrorhamnose reductase [Flavobacteriaceae bacterium]